MKIQVGATKWSRPTQATMGREAGAYQQFLVAKPTVMSNAAYLGKRGVLALIKQLPGIAVGAGVSALIAKFLGPTKLGGSLPGAVIEPVETGAAQKLAPPPPIVDPSTVLESTPTQVPIPILKPETFASKTINTPKVKSVDIARPPTQHDKPGRCATSTRWYYD